MGIGLEDDGRVSSKRAPVLRRRETSSASLRYTTAPYGVDCGRPAPGVSPVLFWCACKQIGLRALPVISI